MPTDTATSDLLKNDLDDYYKSPAEEIVEDDQTEADEADSGEEEVAEQDEESEAAETDDSEEEEGGEPGEEVIIDGRAEKVTKAELIKGYQRQADYTRKTQALAEKNKAFDADRAKLDESLQLFNAMGEELQKLIMGDVSNIDWQKLRDEDFVEYSRLKEIAQERQGALQQVAEKVRKLEADQLPKEQAALFKTMGWDHPEKGVSRREADIAVLNEYFGNSPALAKAKDAETMTALIESAKYRKLQKEKAAVKQELKKAPKVTKSTKVSKPASKNWLDSWYS